MSRSAFLITLIYVVWFGFAAPKPGDKSFDWVTNTAMDGDFRKSAIKLIEQVPFIDDKTIKDLHAFDDGMRQLREIREGTANALNEDFDAYQNFNDDGE